MYSGVKHCAFRQQVIGKEVIASLEDACRSIPQADFHFATQHYQPLRSRRAMKIAADARRAVPHLEPLDGKSADSIALGEPPGRAMSSSRNFA